MDKRVGFESKLKTYGKIRMGNCCHVFLCTKPPRGTRRRACKPTKPTVSSKGYRMRPSTRVWTKYLKRNARVVKRYPRCSSPVPTRPRQQPAMEKSKSSAGNVENLMPDFFLDEAMKVAESGKVKTPSTKPDINTVEGIFSAISSRMNADLVKSVGAVFQFVLTGKDEGKWYVDLKNGAGSAGKGEATTTPDATLTMDSKNFFALFTGKTKATTAFMTGKLKISGNLQKAMKLEKLMGSLKAKL